MTWEVMTPNVRAKPGPTDGRLAGADDDATARPRRPSARLLGLGLSEGLGVTSRGAVDFPASW
jgi:hypothetical protein